MEFTYENRKEIETSIYMTVSLQALSMIMIKEKSGFFVITTFWITTIQMKETACFSEMLYFERCKAVNFGAWEMLLMEYG